MNNYSENLPIKSSKRLQIIDITDKINRFINNSDVTNGIAIIFSKHSTSSIIINENEKGLLNDFEKILTKIVPDKNSYEHDIIDNNADSHLRSMILGSSETIPIKNNKLDLGTWQSVFFIEFDGPRNRNIELIAIGT
ncbi:MAG: secondary thiamine-phosphate synthase enzyme YjbQ [Methanobrevibacter sp.]|nr:secondary thiamine-phosphate synthase enzyme YjbQ [Methanobrevibacter sp.]